MKNKTTIVATGDSFITRRLPEGGYEGLSDLKTLINQYDVRFNNLEMTTHDKEGYPSAVSGGTWAMADPMVLDDLKAYGFNVFNTANNHSCDYGHGGLLATIRNLKERGMIYAGTGANLFEAASPAYVETKNARVALLGICSTFCPSDTAGNQSVSMCGRPGLNPLRHKKEFHVPKEAFDILKEIAEKTNLNAEKFLAIQNGYAHPTPDSAFMFGDLCFHCASDYAMHTSPFERDMVRMESMIQEARRQADYVIVSFHHHEFSGKNKLDPAEFIRTFCQRCIDSGADILLGHGPHEVQGIEIYRGKPILYSLGNFIFETETVALQPADAYENAGITHATMVGEYIDRRSENGTKGYVVQENIWRSVVAGFTAIDGKIEEITLYPLSLEMDKPRGQRGIPRLEPSTAVLEHIAQLSEVFGTTISIENGLGVIRINSEQEV